MNKFKIYIYWLLMIVLILWGHTLLISCTGECSYDEDCVGESLCVNGLCKEKKLSDHKKTPVICNAGEKRTCFSGPDNVIGKGICKAGTQECMSGRWSVCVGSVMPEAKEKCDGVDNNCDGHVDEGCSCKDGAKQKCYTGSPNTRNKGICSEGMQVCLDGEWGQCLNQQLPQKEKCDKIDNNCNGLIDDGVSRKCQTKCGIGEEICVNGQFKSCSAPTPTTEKCGDNKDNDCDGSVDEGCECTPNETRFCYTGKTGTANEGVCKKGKQNCSSTGKWLDCVGQITPKIEQCNKKDDDCNGRIDDGLKQTCQRGCNTGEEFCRDGKWQGCNAAPSDPEVCDGKDNDCNGKIDDIKGGKKCQCNVGTKQICYDGDKATLGKGTCKSGQKTCQSDGQWSLCVGQILPSAESCDGKDNDCDGAIDNQPKSTLAVSRPCYDGDPSTADKGDCRKGIQHCKQQKWTTCSNQILPKKEECNNKDDDCNGKIDDNLTRSCYSGASGTSVFGECHKGTETCRAGKWGICQGEVVPKVEICNKKDDDCDGKIDEQGVCDVCKSGQKQSCYTGAIQTRNTAPCHAGVADCINGQWGTCRNEHIPQTEQCNNKDDDCNGKIDDKVTRNCHSICGSGKETCTLGSWGACDARKPTKEICDGQDNDCNGKIDDGLRCEILASADSSGKVVFWNPVTFKYRRSLTATGSLRKIAFSFDKKTLAIATTAGVSLWSLPLGTYQTTLRTGSASSIAFSHDSKEIVVATDSKEIQIWTIATKKKRLTVKATDTIYDVAYHSGSRWIAYTCQKTLYFISPKTGKALSSSLTSFYIKSMTASPTGDYILMGGYYIIKIFGIPIHVGRTQLWIASSFPAKKDTSFPNSGSDVYDVSFSADSSMVASSNKTSMGAWERYSQKQRLKLSPDKGDWRFNTAAIDSTNKLVALGAYDRDQSGYYFYVYDVSSSTPTIKLSSGIHKSPVKCVRFQP